MSENPPARKKPENLLLSLALNIVLPALILMRGESWFGWGPVLVLVVGLAFPLGYGLYDLRRRHKINFFSVLGVISVLLTGGIGLLKLPPELIAVKEAAVPLAFGLAILLTAKSKKPLVKLFLFNDDIFDTAKLEAALDARQQRPAFDSLLQRCTLWVAASFGLSAILNFILARIIVTSPGGTPTFNEEIGRLAIWSFPVIVLPCMIVMMFALFQLLKGIQTMTGEEMEGFLRNPPKK
jgi:hypothetical protein